MSDYDNTNSGALFKNEEKSAEHPNWPDYNGSINIEGTDYWISAWLKKVKNGENAGKTFMSLSVRKKEQKGGGKQREPEPQQATTDNFDDDIPF